jgi:RNA polymerase sigma factor (sigma-70 family)
MIIGGTSSQIRDIRLWKELMQGNDQSLGQLMHVHYKALVNYGYKFVKDDEFVKDCIQDIFIDLWHSRTRVAEPDHVKAYLFVSLRRKIFRNRRKLRLTEESNHALSDDSQFPVEFSPEWWLIEEETVSHKTRLVSEKLNALPVRQREVIYLKYYQELSREEISEILSITPQTVSNLLQLAYTHLRKHLDLSSISLFLFILCS